jgi:hypothetical protein
MVERPEILLGLIGDTDATFPVSQPGQQASSAYHQEQQNTIQAQC